MSFDIYIQGFHRGEFASVPRQRVRDAFGEYVTEVEPNYWQLRYNDTNTCKIDLMPHSDPSMIHGFTVERPCGDQRLWDALAFILTLGDLVLYFPGGRAPLVGRSSVTEHLPPDMVEALGQPVVVTSGRGIQHEIQVV